MKVLRSIYLKVLILFAVITISGCTASPELGNYNLQLRNQMQDMIDVLFGGHYTEFMETYVDPDYIKNMGGVNQALRDFDNSEQQRLYADLKLCKNITPFYNENKKELTYTSTVMQQPITFKQIGTKWYMEGYWFKN
ncbi:MAG TPA: hypothetical protein PKA90_04655 [Ignavibacteria bacterium]|nr:hypothetical protein [Ignavibacteria bacterium]HMR39701.1 hypothetical protein [Ignavibacteria bacterium]